MTVYKYLSSERIQALGNATLRATQANALNDPFEIKPFFASIIQRDELHERIKDKSLFEEELRKAFLALPAAQQKAVPFDTLLQFIQQDGVRQQVEHLLGAKVDRLFDTQMPALTSHLRDLMHKKLGCIVGIVSFSEDPRQQLMWAHYAESHKGYVLGFDETHAFFDQRRGPNDEFFHLRQVEYFRPLPVYSSMGELDGARLLCAKHGDWSYEQEHRLLIPLPEEPEDGTEEIHLISFPRESLTTVIVGERTPPAFIAEIRPILSAHAKYASVVLQQARLDFTSGEIQIERLD